MDCDCTSGKLSAQEMTSPRKSTRQSRPAQSVLDDSLVSTRGHCTLSRPPLQTSTPFSASHRPVSLLPGSNSFTPSSSTHKYDIAQNFSQTSDYFSAGEDLDLTESDNTATYQEKEKDDEGFDSVLQNFAPSNLSNLIGRKIGLEEVDIVSALYEKNTLSVLDMIFSFLDTPTLVRVGGVCQKWRTALRNCPDEHRRREQFLASCRSKYEARPKENCCQRRKSIRLTKMTRATSNRHFRSMQQVAETSMECVSLHAEPLPLRLTSQNTNSQASSSYWNAAQELRNDECLRKCPRCCSPARADTVQERARCSRQNCAFDFCIKCHQTFHHGRPCSASHSSKQDISISSRKSKKNLRRL